jgi:hypothetical protein
VRISVPTSSGLIQQFFFVWYRSTWPFGDKSFFYLWKKSSGDHGGWQMLECTHILMVLKGLILVGQKWMN